MNKTEKCIYCQTMFDPAKGEGDHILPVQLGEFRNDIRFRRICTSCNNKIGKSEQQLLLCGPESFFRDLVNPKVPSKRKRGRSQIKGAMGVPCPFSTIDHGDHKQMVRRLKDNSNNVLPVDQIVIHDDKNKECFIELFSGMRPEQLKDRIKKNGINKFDKLWLHCDENYWPEFTQLIKKVWPKTEIQSLPGTDAGITQVKGRTTFKITDHYFRSLAKIAFHYYLSHSRRRFRGDEQCFGSIRDFIMKGGNDKDAFFKKSGAEFAMPFGELPAGGVITPKYWCHIIAADESDKIAVVYLQLFVGNGCVPRPHYVKLADINSNILVLNSTWAHVYLYDESPKSGRYAGQVEQAQITRIR